MIEFNFTTAVFMLFFGWVLQMLLTWLLYLYFPTDVLE